MPSDDALTKSMRRRFQYYDKDGDGRLDAAEVLTMLGDQHVSEQNRTAIGSMLDSLGSVDFDEFVGLWEMVTGFESDNDESEPEQEEKPAPAPEPEPVPEATTPPRDAHRTPPPRNAITPPRMPAAAAVQSGEAVNSAAQMQRPPPLPGPSAARTRPKHPSKPRVKSPSRESAEPQPQPEPEPEPEIARRTRLSTAVSEKQLEIAGNAGLAAKAEELQRAKKKKKKKQKNQGGGCCAARPKKQPSSSSEILSGPAVPDPVMPDAVPSSKNLHVEDSTRALEQVEEVDSLEREQSAPAEVEGWVAPVKPTVMPVEPTAMPVEPTAMHDAPQREDTSPVEHEQYEQRQDGQHEQQSEMDEMETQPALDRTYSVDYTPRVPRTGSSWSRNPTPPRSRPGAGSSSVGQHVEVEEALSQAQAAKDYAEQMLEAAHAAQAEAVQAMREAAAVHATSEARAAAQQLLEEAHAVSRLCCHGQVATSLSPVLPPTRARVA